VYSRGALLWVALVGEGYMRWIGSESSRERRGREKRSVGARGEREV
jgi:hypothetical protein